MVDWTSDGRCAALKWIARGEEAPQCRQEGPSRHPGLCPAGDDVPARASGVRGYRHAAEPARSRHITPGCGAAEGLDGRQPPGGRRHTTARTGTCGLSLPFARWSPSKYPSEMPMTSEVVRTNSFQGRDRVRAAISHRVAFAAR